MRQRRREEAEPNHTARWLRDGPSALRIIAHPLVDESAGAYSTASPTRRNGGTANSLGMHAYIHPPSVTARLSGQQVTISFQELGRRLRSDDSALLNTAADFAEFCLDVVFKHTTADVPVGYYANRQAVKNSGGPHRQKLQGLPRLCVGMGGRADEARTQLRPAEESSNSCPVLGL